MCILVQTTDPAVDPFAITPEIVTQAAERHTKLAAGLEIRFARSGTDLGELISDVDILLGLDAPLSELSRRAPRLQWIHVLAAGVDRLLPLDWLPRSVVLTNSSGVHSGKTAEFAAMAFLMLNSAVPLHATNQRRGVWVDRYSGSIVGKTALVIGLGALGGAAARQAKALGMRVIGVRRGSASFRGLDKIVQSGQLHDVLPEADFVLVATPLTPKTRSLIGRAELDLLKPSCGIVNIGRAAVVDYCALARKLSDGGLAGAILDVFESEPLPADSPLWNVPNLIILPHVSATDADRYIDLLLNGFFEKLQRLLQGRRMTNLVSRRHGY